MLVRPALETLRQKYAAKGDNVSRTIASAMDKIMSAMELADRASTSQVSGFFDGHAWDESRRIIEVWLARYSPAERPSSTRAAPAKKRI